MPTSQADRPSDDTRTDPSEPTGIYGFCKRLGPGLVTGASDDDPSGIATYSQAGAQFQFGLLWAIPFSLPLMAAVQEISARIGRVTGRGIAGNVRKYYSGWLLYPVVFLLLVTNTINLGADIGAMGAALKLVVGGPAHLYSVAFAVLCVVLQVFLAYKRLAGILKWMALVLLAYIATGFIVHIPWGTAIFHTFVPHVQWSGAYFAAFVAVLGTTISPYLFFWQASMETEEIREKAEDQPLKFSATPREARFQFMRIRWDTWAGMTVSNLVAYFIILTAAATLHGHVNDITSSEQAAAALRPVAGRAASLVFALGIIGTGLLAVPVLAGSAAYAVGEAMKWPTGLNQTCSKAAGFYGVLAAATILGLAINFTPIDPIKALFWSAVLNGIVAVPILIVMMLMLSSRKVMGKYARISPGLKFMGWLTTAVMAATAAGMFITWRS